MEYLKVLKFRIPTSAALDQLSSDSGLIAGPGPSADEMATFVGLEPMAPTNNAAWRLFVIDGLAREAVQARLRFLRNASGSRAAHLCRELDRLAQAPQVLGFVFSEANEPSGNDTDQAYEVTLYLLRAMMRVRKRGFQSVWSDDWVTADPEAGRTLGLSSRESLMGILYIGSNARNTSAAH